MSNIFGAKRPLGELTYRIRVRYKDGQRDSCWMSGGDLGTIFAASDRSIAERRARQMAGDHEGATYHVVPFRTAVKAPPPLHVGDEVLVRGRLSEIGLINRTVEVETSKGYFRVAEECVVRAAKEWK